MVTLKQAAIAASASIAAVATLSGSVDVSSLESCTGSKQEGPAQVHTGGSMVTIAIKGANWGEGRPVDIRLLLENVAWHMTRHLRDGVDITVEVRHWSSNPMILFRPPGQTTYTIFLSATGRRWAQYSYQFAHEFCHLLSGYDQLEDSANGWFHESICEAASLYTLRSMGMTWASHPPYPN